ncbi:MAG TPA: hypothetical protein VK435_00275, partial [Thermodesulfovibrionales bacterium]|nr:hypothetical protein [Thermodesulfovibrionales bacterium]
IDTKSVESVRHVLSSGKGAIVIGAHYGPLLQTYLLNRRHLPVKAFMARQFASELNSIDRLVLKPLRSGMVAFLTDPGVILVSQGDERRIIEHIKEGGVAVMYIDYPGPPGAGKTATFLGLPMHPHTTLFRLAIKYDIPVFFSFFNDVSDRGYRMNLVPSGDFSTPAEGYQRYADYLQTQIEECPFMWGFLPHFFEIFQVGTDGV